MYPNLIIAMKRKKVSMEDVAVLLRIHRNSVSYKINGNGSFSIEEGFLVHGKLFPETDLHYLLEKDK